MRTNMTRLQLCCKFFNWQGGTIHQVNAEFRRVFSDMYLPDKIKTIDVLTCDYSILEQAMYIYSKNN